jgi:hypothetical protein
MRGRVSGLSLLAAAVLTAAVLAGGGCSSSSGGGGNPTSGMDASSQEAGQGVEAGDGADGGKDAAPEATADAALDAATTDGSSGATDAGGPPPTCGPPPNRFTILSGADAGLVRDNVTELVWMSDSVGGAQTSQQTQPLAATYCKGRGMRLPTESEALALAAAYAPCAFGQWGTWTSTDVGTSGDAWVVDYLGDASPQLADNFPSAVLCVRDPAG